MADQWPLTGRDDELAAMLAAVDDPDGGGLVLAGPQGVGRTRLAHEIAQRLAAGGHRTAHATASRAAAAVGFGALAHLLPDGLAPLAADQPLELLRRADAVIAAIAGTAAGLPGRTGAPVAPGGAGHAGSPGAPARTAPPDLQPAPATPTETSTASAPVARNPDGTPGGPDTATGQDEPGPHATTGGAGARTATGGIGRDEGGAGEAAGRRPVLVVDDAHLLDELSAAFLHQVALRRLATLVVTVSSDGAPPDAVTALWKDGLLTRCDVGPLSRAATAGLLERVLDGHLDLLSLRRLQQTAAGNPLFLREIVHAALADGSLARHRGLWQWDGALAVSDRLIELVRARLADADPACGPVLDLVAWGEPLPVWLAEQLAGAASVEAAEQAGLVDRTATGPTAADPRGDEVLRFAHPVHGVVLRSTTAVGRRRTVCAELAGALLEWTGGRGPDLLRIAAWLLEADAPPGDRPVSFAAAGHLALEDDDPSLAERLARAALEEPEAAAEHHDETERAAALAVLVDVLEKQGRHDELARLRQALSRDGLPAPTTAPADVRPIAARADVHATGRKARPRRAATTGAARQPRPHRPNGVPGGAPDTCRATEPGKTTIPDAPAAAHGPDDMATTTDRQPEHTAGPRAPSTATGDTPERSAGSPDDTGGTAADDDRARELAGRPRAGQVGATAAGGTVSGRDAADDSATAAAEAWVLLLDSRLAESIGIAQVVLARADATPQAQVRAASAGTAALGLGGRTAEALAAADAGLAAARSLDPRHRWGYPQVVWARALALVAAGRLEEARSHLEPGGDGEPAERAGDPASLVGMWQGFRGLVARLQGDHATARSSLREAVTLLDQAGPADRADAAQDMRHGSGHFARLWLAELAASLACSGDPRGGREVFDLAVDRDTGTTRVLEPWIALDGAWVCAGEGRSAEAVDVALRAADMAVALGHRAFEVTAAFDVARLGRPDLVEERLTALVPLVEGRFAPACRDATRALLHRDPHRLADCSRRFEALGHDLVAAELGTAAGGLLPVGAADAAARARRLRSRCPEAVTPLLRVDDDRPPPRSPRQYLRETGTARGTWRMER